MTRVHADHEDPQDLWDHAAYEDIKEMPVTQEQEARKGPWDRTAHEEIREMPASQE